MAWTDEQLTAWLDGEAPPEESARIAAALAADPGLEARLAAQRRLKQRLDAHFGPVAQEPVPERFRALLESGNEDADVVDLAAARSARSQRAARNWGLPQLSAIAASLAIGLLAGQAFLAAPAGPAQDSGGALMLAADGPIAGALDTQLASAQATDAPVRIGLSFRDSSGAYCRTFDAAEIAGLACKRGGAWRMAIAVAAEGAATPYRQAGAASPLVLEHAEAMMTGDPLDAAAERRASEAGWD